VVELDEPEIEELVRSKASRLGFSAVHQMLEIQGLCGNCQPEG
jgi:Fe2+ or Zn2+ uptake regulation protein